MTSKQFCLKWNNFQNSILNAFESLQTTEDLTDVTLTCNGFNIKAHKFILSACSPYFRTVFKENPCSHPIIILKDVLHVDLIAIINFMYHGEVLVSEVQLASFLETAKLLQVSGLNQSTTMINNEYLNTTIKKSPKKMKYLRSESIDQHYPIIKKSRICTKSTKLTKNNENFINDTDKQHHIDSSDDDEQQQSDVNENLVLNTANLVKNEQSSILEAVLELKEPKVGSILERSLTSQSIAGKSPTSVPPSVMNLSQSVFVAEKPPDSCELENILPQQRAQIRTIVAPSSGSSSPLIFERPTEFLQQTIKIEEDSYDSNDNLQPQQHHDDVNKDMQILKSADQQPHHSSQCGNCPHCGKMYSNQSALKYHVRLVHSDLTNMYCCHLCPEAFDYREGYKKHMVEVHCVRN